ncbi:hypothetical protein COU80_04845 [Candidatus Peregrinibacteria bacterium CG10_big_fil_rev_8_21_14_0_10_55_24]|nr:MAG: hypothetical protein COU80_04845 [Candidatus Peregrinibacteria bacterium CG10_big_fil_rev_8_21_14_0_10_55_24]
MEQSDSAAERPEAGSKNTDGVQQLCDIVFALPQETLANDVRKFLASVLAFHDASVDSAARWLTAPNTAFGGVPAVLIREGKTRQLLGKWQELATVHGY